jgi:hypothetical protein
LIFEKIVFRKLDFVFGILHENEKISLSKMCFVSALNPLKKYGLGEFGKSSQIRP